MPLFLLDTSVLITAHDHYYPIDRVPEFWSWLLHRCSAGDIKIPREIFDEIKDGGKDGSKDLLYGWIQDADVKDAVLFDEDPDVALVQKVLANGYAPDLTDDETLQIGNDPFLIAYAAVAPSNRTVVTTEVSKPKKVRQNRRIPDVCKTMGVLCIDTFELVRVLDFKTSWKP